MNNLTHSHNSRYARAIDAPALLARLGARSRDCHKGDFGHVLMVGGNNGMGGALILAAEAAARCGAGKVTALTRRQSHVTALLARSPDIMSAVVESADAARPYIERATVIVVGPGLGLDDWACALLNVCCASKKPLVIDADGLNLIARKPVIDWQAGQVVLTPHPGEAERLLKPLGAVDAKNSGREQVALTLAERYRAVVVLKGASTLVCEGGTTWINSTGNPGMAKGGMGDVLSGVVGALLAQGLKGLDAASLAVWVHGRAADIAVTQTGERGLMASDLLIVVGRLLSGHDVEASAAIVKDDDGEAHK